VDAGNGDLRSSDACLRVGVGDEASEVTGELGATSLKGSDETDVVEMDGRAERELLEPSAFESPLESVLCGTSEKVLSEWMAMIFRRRVNRCCSSCSSCSSCCSREEFAGA
jgi:hypothetical protein